uniref:Family with sequence similarity 8 member A1a n=1 Tax=Sinocyclocheilus rhinocerous TaxID=307959 RepID=A0A673M318_9TELE
YADGDKGINHARNHEDRQTVKNGQGSDDNMTTTEYCKRLQQWMWRYYSGYVSWQLGAHVRAALSSASVRLPGTRSDFLKSVEALKLGSNFMVLTSSFVLSGREYTIPSALRRFLAETVDFFILFCFKATIVLWIMHLSGMKDISKFMMQFIVEEIDEDTSLEDLQKMMVVALAYRVLVCVYEIICIWGAGGATPGKFLLGLRVVTCDTTVLVQPNRVLVVPASSVSFSASTVLYLNKNFSIAFLFPIFITLLFFQHNRTVYDVVAGTIVVQRRRAR